MNNPLHARAIEIYCIARFTTPFGCAKKSILTESL